jgi:hypothetical protein
MEWPAWTSDIFEKGGRVGHSVVKERYVNHPNSTKFEWTECGTAV